MGIISSLSRQQKEAVGLLQIGTFLEYFDLMLYVHMAVLLNELFFPQTDPHTAALLAAFAFCSSFVLRPFGALIFGYIGDHIGRKSTVIVTTMMMSTSCIVMANLPIYAQIGIAATWIVTLCRIVQGLSSMGEIMGAMVYVTETTKPPVQYPAVAFISLASGVGAFAALGVASLVTTAGFDWRIAFWVGACIAVIGSIARTRLRETPDFLDKKRQRERHKKQKTVFVEEKIDKKSVLNFFLVFCGWPLSFYIVFMYFNPLLKADFGYSSADVIHHNFYLSIVLCASSAVLAFLSYRIYPLKLLMLRGRILLVLIPFLPFLISHASSPVHIFIIQALLTIFSLGEIPAGSILITYFPVLKRVTAVSFLYALSRSVMYIITSFGLVYITGYFGHYGLWFLFSPITIGFLWGVNYFWEREREAGNA